MIRLFCYILITFLFLPCVVSGQMFIEGTKPYITQLHIHGWSNHNGADKPGSHQYHNKQADSVNVDVLWWTEHNFMYQQIPFSLFLSGASIDSATLDIIGQPGITNGHYSGWKCLEKEGTSNAILQNDTLILSIASSINSQWESLTYAPRSILGLIRDINYAKPLASIPVLNFTLNTSIFNVDDSRIRMVFKLSWHYRDKEGQDVIVYDFLSSISDTSIYSNNNDSVFVNIPLGTGYQSVSLDIAHAASMLQHGIDNTLSDFEITLMSRLGATTEASLSTFYLQPQQTDADSIVAIEREILDHYSAMGMTHNILGVEYSRAVHLNAFIPKYTNNKSIFMGHNFGDHIHWVNMVKLAGGLVSYNHMFGTDWTIDTDSLQDYRADTLAKFLFANKAYGSDILEVGYNNRGGGDLLRHLRVWDQLTAKGLFMYGNGVSDSHGNEWMNNVNLFHTWIYAADSSDTALLSALSRGKMCFGIHHNFKGDFWYSAGNLELGDRGFVNNRFEQLKIFLTDAPPGSVVKLTQILLDDSDEIKYVYNEFPLNLSSLPLLDFGKPCFIRLGVYKANGKPLIFGQPIVVMGISEDTLLIENSDRNALMVFPNPATDQIYFEFHVAQHGNYKIRMLDELSRQVAVIENRFFYEGRYGFSHNSNSLASGVYFVECSGEGENITKKIVVR